MSLKSYSNYKESGCDDVGNIPDHWIPTRLRFLLLDGSNGLKIGPFGSQLTSEMLDGNGTHKVYGQENIIGNDFSRGDRLIGEEKFSELRVYEIRPGDLLITMMGTSGRCDVAPKSMQPGIMDSHLLRMRVAQKVQPQFIRILIDEASYVESQIKLAGKGSIMHGLNSTIVKNLLVFVPPVDEQVAILEFLERETAKIDGLIAEQRRLIELLKEKRQAVISHAVTRGLNPHAPVKLSAIEWLGEVPMHWTVASVRRVVARIEQGWSPECLGRPAEGDEWGVMKSGCVNRGTFMEHENKALPGTLEPVLGYEIRSGDVLMSRASGSPELVGSTAYVTTVRQRLMLSDKIFRIHPEPNIDRRFFVALFNSRTMRSQIQRAISGAEGLANNLPQSAMKSFYLAIPPLDEQVEIINFLDAETAKFDTLTAEAECAIDLLQERRAALISAAVTGQIDVRQTGQTG